MEIFGTVFGLCVSLLKIPFTIYGFTLDLWQVLLYAAVAAIVFWSIGQLLGGD